MDALKKEFILCPKCNTIFITYPTIIETCPQCGNIWEIKKKKEHNILFKILQHIKVLIKMRKIKHFIKQNKEKV